MMVLTSPSTNIGDNPGCAQPPLQYQEPPSEVAEDAAGKQPRSIAHKVVLHCRTQSKGRGTISLRGILSLAHPDEILITGRGIHQRLHPRVSNQGDRPSSS